MENQPEQSVQQIGGEKKKKKPSLLLITLVIGTIGLIAQLLWVNWPKPVADPESLNAELVAVIDRLPGTSDALIYAGLKDIKQSPFWQEVMPDSLKEMNWLQTNQALRQVVDETGFVPARDLDTLLIAFQQQNTKKQKYLGILWGAFEDKLTTGYLEEKSIETKLYGNEECYALSDTLWVCRPENRQVILANSEQLLRGFLEPEKNFLDRDQTTATLIDKAIYKSHFWFTLSSTNWTLGALQSLTSGNKDVKTLGNLNRIKQLALSLKFDDGVEGHTEWIYQNRTSAYFASTFLWGAIKLSSSSGTRTAEPAKAFLKELDVMQNLESVIVKTDLPLSFFRSEMENGENR
ncbi:hypothetical protein [Prosthecochloris sp.]|uniref:hypothetical protein n=1 Tax=Prosthecochloris sp. TaxID=290513 RepID=UPI0025E7D045|nr:hypothetical protein [Prosthecochloris sp.]